MHMLNCWDLQRVAGTHQGPPCSPGWQPGCTEGSRLGRPAKGAAKGTRQRCCCGGGRRRWGQQRRQTWVASSNLRQPGEWHVAIDSPTGPACSKSRTLAEPWQPAACRPLAAQLLGSSENELRQWRGHERHRPGGPAIDVRGCFDLDTVSWHCIHDSSSEHARNIRRSQPVRWIELPSAGRWRPPEGVPNSLLVMSRPS